MLQDRRSGFNLFITDLNFDISDEIFLGHSLKWYFRWLIYSFQIVIYLYPNSCCESLESTIDEQCRIFKFSLELILVVWF